MKKRVAAVLLSMVMVMTFMPALTFAEDGEAEGNMLAAVSGDAQTMTNVQSAEDNSGADAGKDIEMEENKLSNEEEAASSMDIPGGVPGFDDLIPIPGGQKYTITAGEVSHGTLEISGGKTEAESGEEVSVVVTPDDGYKVLNVNYEVGGAGPYFADKQADGSFKFEMPQGDVMVTALIENHISGYWDYEPGTDANRACWDVVDDATYYRVRAKYVNGSTTTESDWVTSEKGKGQNAKSFETFINANGSGKYSFEVEAYNTDNVPTSSDNPIITTDDYIAEADFYQIQIIKKSLGIDGAQTDEDGGSISVDVDRSGGEVLNNSANGEKTVVRKKGSAEINIIPESKDGFLTKEIKIDNEVRTGTEFSFSLEGNHIVEAIFRKTAETKTAKFDAVHASAAEKILEAIKCQTSDEKSCDIHDANATLADGVITFHVNKAWTNSDIQGELEDAMSDAFGSGWHQVPVVDEQSGEMLETNVTLLKPMSEYSSETDIEDENDANHYVVAEDGHTYHSLWNKPVKEILLTVGEPLCGTSVVTSVTEVMERGIRQTNAPAISVNDGVAIQDGYGEDGYWLESIGSNTFMYDADFFNGTIKGGEKYKFVTILSPGFGYYFDPDEISVKINGKDPIRVQAYDYLFVYGDVTAVHDWDEGTVTKKPTATAEGIRTYKCKNYDTCGGIKTEAIPRLTPAISTTARTSSRSMIVKWTWGKVKGAKKYKVAYRKAGSNKWKIKKTKKTKKMRYVVKRQKLKGLYEYKVAAVTNTGDIWSNVSYRYFKGVKASAKPGKGSINVRWKKDKGATGYEVLIAKNRKMKNAKRFEVSSSENSYKVTGLKKGKTYYVRVRPMKDYNGVTYTGVLCKARKATIK